MSDSNSNKGNKIAGKWATFRGMAAHDKKRVAGDLILNNAMYIIIFIAIVFIAVKVPAFISLSSIINIISLTAAKYV